MFAELLMDAPCAPYYFVCHVRWIEAGQDRVRAGVSTDLDQVSFGQCAQGGPVEQPKAGPMPTAS